MNGKRTPEEPMLTLSFTLATGEEHNVTYSCICKLLEDDTTMRPLFEKVGVTSCTVYCGSKRITGLGIMEWPRLKEAVVANAVSILRATYVGPQLERRKE